MREGRLIAISGSTTTITKGSGVRRAPASYIRGHICRGFGSVAAVSFCVVLFLATTAAFGVDINTDPGWLIYEKGKQLFDSGDFGESLFYFRQARERFGDIPEVEYWIGRVFEAEGEYSLAELQYELALDRAEFLEVRDDVYDVHYRLASLFFTQKRFSLYVSELRSIMDRDSETRRMSGDLYLDGRLLSKTLAEKGIDKLMELYRIDDRGGLDAYYRLGVYELRTGLVENAAELLTVSTVITFTTILDYLLKRDPEYRFTSFPELLTMALKFRLVADYLNHADAFGQLYALALALRGSGEAPKVELGEQILTVLTGYDAGGFWGQRAKRQLDGPFEDDFMIVF